MLARLTKRRRCHDDPVLPSRIPHGRTARRVQWSHLPPTVRAHIEVRLGSPVEDAASQGGGFTPGFASVLTCEDGSRHFVKAASVKAQRMFADAYREEARKLVEVTAECLILALEQVRPGQRIGDLGFVIQRHAEARGYSVVREFQGHGVGRKFHTAPDVPHFGKRDTGVRLRRGMSFTIEPMINIGDWPVKILADDWTAVTRDGSLSAQFEHTIIVTEDGFEAMTAPEGVDPLKTSPGGVITLD